MAKEVACSSAAHGPGGKTDQVLWTKNGCLRVDRLKPVDSTVRLPVPGRCCHLFQIMLILLMLTARGYGQEGTDSSPPAKGSAPPATPEITPLTRDEAVRLALAQASIYQQARWNERIAEEGVRQARRAFLPQFGIPLAFIYNSPSSAVREPGTPQVPSFIAADAVTQFQGLAGVTGELDLAGRLRATLRRDRALLEAAHAGTEVARRALVQATDEAYLGLALAAACRHSAELALSAAEDFERNTRLLASGGEVAEIDLVRARLQATTRRDEAERARADEFAAADSLRLLVGFRFDDPIAVTDLLTMECNLNTLNRFGPEAIAALPEVLQFDAEKRVAEQEKRLAHADRWPLLTYTFGGGFDTDSLRTDPFHDHLGVTAIVSLSIPIFDWGTKRSQEHQAQYRLAAIESSRAVALRGFEQQFHTVRAQAVSAVARVRLAEAGVADAQHNVDVSMARYRAGEAAIIEVTDALGGVASQRTALAQALYDYQIALVRLKQVTGE